ncbi:hypothetical protein [Gulosibacter sp. ACHW.36C]|uniref:Lipoprotein n=1 Tax=Gulosibacter sediminis TaxID=1729695 RepID=A0ABY4MYL1_9MICO|nr:hypothetical protein [Gulosibacter sediminis]UQN15528.1 hypothetical protein M3M28_03450 [Gulosibacter sediminis]
MIPVAALGLTACASTSSPEAGDSDSSSSNDAGSTRPAPPFVWGEESATTEPEPSPAPIEPPPTAEAPEATQDTPQATADTGGSSGSSGGNVVKYGDVDLSDKDWDVSCTDDYANGYVFDGENGDDYHSVSVSLNEDGSVDYVMIDSDTNFSLYYSDGVSGYPELAATASYTPGVELQASGTGTVDYEFTEYEDFEITLKCDSTF